MEEYISREMKSNSTVEIQGRYGYERYQDFTLYSSGDWHKGEKAPIMVAECESNPGELLGELSGLMTIRCPFKYLFIEEGSESTFEQLKAFCDKSLKTDWAGTTYYVIEIPQNPLPPSNWKTFKAHIEKTGDKLSFEQQREL